MSGRGNRISPFCMSVCAPGLVRDTLCSHSMVSFGQKNCEMHDTFFQCWQVDRQTDTETDNTALYTIKKFDNEHAKSPCAPPYRYKATLCTTKVYVGTELHCRGRPPLLTDIGPPCATWCTTQAGSAQCRSMVHNIVLCSLGGTQSRSRQPPPSPHTHKDGTDLIT